MPSDALPKPPTAAHSDDTDAQLQAAKAALRSQLAAARRIPETLAEATARTARALRLSSPHRIVALYASAGNEPDTWRLIAGLHSVGHRLLLPVVGPVPDGSPRRAPDWAWYAGPDHLRLGYRRIPEPDTGSLGPEALSHASLVWCAALAASPQGDRLGTGGGWYDRALRCARPDAEIAVLLRDTEVLPALPVGPLDRRVGLIVTEARELRCPAPGRLAAE